MSRKFKLCALAAGLLAAAPLAQAFEGGDFVLRAGVVNVSPDDSSESITVGGAPLLGAGTNAQVTVDDDNQLGLRATYMLTNHFGIGVLGATPFKHDINGGGDIPSNLKLGETKHLPPTLTLQYYPLNSNSAFQPFAGVGVNYTIFFEEKTTSTLDGALGVGSSELELDDSVGLALEAGFDYMLSENFGLNAAIWWADINTDASVKVYDGAGNFVAETDEFEVELDPMVYMVGFTYKF